MQQVTRIKCDIMHPGPVLSILLGIELTEKIHYKNVQKKMTSFLPFPVLHGIDRFKEFVKAKYQVQFSISRNWHFKSHFKYNTSIPNNFMLLCWTKNGSKMTLDTFSNIYLPLSLFTFRLHSGWPGVWCMVRQCPRQYLLTETHALQSRESHENLLGFQVR